MTFLSLRSFSRLKKVIFIYFYSPDSYKQHIHNPDSCKQHIHNPDSLTSNIAIAVTEANSDTLTQGVQSAVTGQSKSAFASFFSLKGIFLSSKNNLVVTVLAIFYSFLVIVLYTPTKTLMCSKYCEIIFNFKNNK